MKNSFKKIKFFTIINLNLNQCKISCGQLMHFSDRALTVEKKRDNFLIKEMDGKFNKSLFNGTQLQILKLKIKLN